MNHSDPILPPLPPSSHNQRAEEAASSKADTIIASEGRLAPFRGWLICAFLYGRVSGMEEILNMEVFTRRGP